MKPPLHLAKPNEVSALGFTITPEAELKLKFLEKLEDMLPRLRSLMTMLDTCTKCGNCIQECHSYLGTGDYNNIPAARADLMRSLYKRYFTWAGRKLNNFVGAQDFDNETIGKWLTYFYQCNECRRCARFCPFGIDTAEITIAARHIMSELGIMPKFMQGVAANMVKTGNNMGINKLAILDSVEFMEDDLFDETGHRIKIPVDKPESDVLYIPSSADFFTNVDTMYGAAKLFYQLKVNWTISSAVLEAANFGLLFNYNAMHAHNLRLKETALAVGAKLVIQGECGHGWRAAKMYTEGLNGPAPFGLMHIHEFCDQHLSEIKFNKLPLRVALHDPCNYARAGDIIDQPRRILKACAAELVEMTPNREDNFCCGGGSGILMDEMMDIRMKLGRKKAEQVAALGEIDYLAIPCSICKAQIPPVMKYYGLTGFEMGGVMDLVGKAMVLE